MASPSVLKLSVNALAIPPPGKAKVPVVRYLSTGLTEVPKRKVAKTLGGFGGGDNSAKLEKIMMVADGRKCLIFIRMVLKVDIKWRKCKMEQQPEAWQT